MGSIELKILIKNCLITVFSSSLLISCPDRFTYQALIKHRKDIPSIFPDIFKQLSQEIFINKQNFYISSITIGIGDISTSFPVVPLPKLPMLETETKQVSSGQILIVPQKELINECLSYEGACGIVRMSDHKGLFCNTQIVLSSNAHPNDWGGKDMSKWWIEDELNTYLERLKKDGELRNYSYVAMMMTGEKARLTVDAKQIIWNGEPARMVKTISRELLT